MFTNPLNRKYQTGGSTPTDDQKKDMQEFVTWIKSNVEGFKDKSEQEIAKSLSDMAKSDEGKKSVQNLYSRYQKSKKQKSKFADGGKFQDFICKHARGGDIGCGCNGGKVIRGEDGIDGVPDGFLQSDTPIHAAALAAKKTVRLPWFGIGRRRVGATIDQNGGKHFYEWGDVNGNTAQTVVSIPALGDTIVKQSVATNRGWIPNTYPQGSNQYETIMERFRPIVDTGVPYKEDGGIVMGRDGLSRRQVRQDKRKVLRAMNRPTAGAQYEDLVNKTRNWDRFAGMSRLERKNAINQLILNGEKPVVQTPIQPDLGENYVINETTVPYQFFNPIPEIVETPKTETVIAQTQSVPASRRNATTRRTNTTAAKTAVPQTTSESNTVTISNPDWISEKQSNIIKPIVNTPSVENHPLHSTPRPEDTVMYPSVPGAWTTMTPVERMWGDFGKYPLEGAAEWGQGGIYETDDEGNRIIKDEGNGVYWTRDAEGRLQKHEPVVRSYNFMRYTSPTRNYSWTGQIIPEGANYWQAFKKGGTLNSESKKKTLISNTQSVEKYQKGKGKENLELEIPVTTPIDSSKVEYMYFPKITPFGLSRKTATFKGSDGRTHTWVKYSNGVYNWKASPGHQMNTYSPKQTEVNVKKVGLAGVKDVMLPIDNTIMLQIDNLMKKINK